MVTKSRLVFRIGTGDDYGRYFSVSVIIKDKKDDCASIDSYIKNEPHELKEQILSRLSGCDSGKCLMCSVYRSGKYIELSGKRHHMCGEELIECDWAEPTETDMTMINRLIKIRCEMIDNAK